MSDLAVRHDWQRTLELWQRTVRPGEPARMQVKRPPLLLFERLRVCPPGSDLDSDGICDVLDLSATARGLLRGRTDALPDQDRDGLPDLIDPDRDNDGVPNDSDPAPDNAQIPRYEPVEGKLQAALKAAGPARAARASGAGSAAGRARRSAAWQPAPDCGSCVQVLA